MGSRWQMSCDTEAHSRNGHVRDLSYNVITNEGRKCKFMPTRNGLHALVVNEKSVNEVFGELLTENGTQFGEAMSYMCLDNHCNDKNITGVTATEEIEDTGVTDHSNFSGVITDDDDKIDVLDDAIDTIAKSRRKFSRRDQLKADRTRHFQHVSGFLANYTLLHSLGNNGVNNSPITVRDASITNDMLGANIYTVQGKQMKHQPDVVDIDEQTVAVLPHISKHYVNVELSVDVMYVNNIPFLISLSEHLHYGTIGAVDSLRCETL